MTVVVRPAHVDELGYVGELTVAAYAEYVVPGDRYLAHLRDAVTRAREAELYVAEHEDPALGLVGLVGTVTFCPQGSPFRELAGPEEGEFRMLGVHPDARGQGVAAGLVSACLERSRELGFTSVVLSSLPVQTTAHRVYARFGFRRLPDRDWSPSEHVDLWAFGLDLD